MFRILAPITATAFGLLSTAEAKTLQECAAIPNDQERVACYDEVAGRSPNRDVSAEAAKCEAELVDRLFSPPGYRRIDIQERRNPLPLDKWVEQQLYEIRDRNLSSPDTAVSERATMRKREEKMRAAGATPTVATIVITYDAPNRMSALVRDTEFCAETIVPDGF